MHVMHGPAGICAQGTGRDRNLDGSRIGGRGRQLLG